MKSTMIKKPEIRWVHISDLHIGSQANQWSDELLRSRLYNLLKQQGDIDFALITGDIFHQGDFTSKQNVSFAKCLVDVLRNKIETVLVCAGNHDYKRNDVRDVLLEKWQCSSERDKFNEEPYYRVKLQGDFEGFSKVCEEINISNASRLAATNVYLDIEGINIVLLNTSVFAGQPELGINGKPIKNNGIIKVSDYGKIHLTEDDLPRTHELKPDWPTIIVGHHPLEMLDDISKKRLIDLMEGIPSYHYYCGHSHMESTIEICDRKYQHCNSGLFIDDYNEPVVSIHTIRKANNTNVKSEYYRFKNGEWYGINCRQNETKSVLKERNDNLSVSCLGFERLSDHCCIAPSAFSDGAYSFFHNNGRFNIYVSKAKPDDILVPHAHSDSDELTYVVKGRIVFFTDSRSELFEEGSIVDVRKDTFHSFIPIEYPSEYITMSSSNLQSEATHARSWTEDIELIKSFENESELSTKTTFQNSDTLKRYDSLIGFLGSEILEVSWRATYVIKNLIAEDNEVGNYIKAKVDAFISSLLISEEIEKKLYAIRLASEFRLPLTPERINHSLTFKDNCMMAWASTYNVVMMRTNCDYISLFQTLLVSDEYDPYTKYHELCLISVSELLIHHNADLLDKVKKLDVPELSISIEDILSHFAIWYTSFTFQDTKFNYTKAAKVVRDVCPDLADEFLRAMQGINDSYERADVVKQCKDRGVLLQLMKAFFESIEDINNDGIDKYNTIKEEIKHYLRVIVSDKCNLRCPYCHHEGRIDSLISNKITCNESFDINALLNKALRSGFRKIKISGGEPLLFPDILQICHEYEGEFEDIGFTSNGTQLLELKSTLERIKGTRLSFNITLNSVDPVKYQEITGLNALHKVKDGIEYLVDNGFNVKINSVITTKNLDDIEGLVSYAARLGVNIKLLDLFNTGCDFEDYKHVSIAEIKSRVMDLYRKKESDFLLINDYISVDVFNIKVLIPKRVYSVNCQLNCNKYPCAEGLFGIRVFEDYSCAYCFDGKVYKGGLEQFENNIERIRNKIDSVSIAY